MKRIVLMSIRPIYASRIFTGEKKYEFRRTKPGFKPGSVILVYSTRPKTCIIGHFILKNVLVDTIFDLWEQVEKKAGLSYKEYLTYFEGSDLAYALEIAEPILWESHVTLEEIREEYPDYNPPQCYHYVELDHPIAKFAEELTII